MFKAENQHWRIATTTSDGRKSWIGVDKGKMSTDEASRNIPIIKEFFNRSDINVSITCFRDYGSIKILKEDSVALEDNLTPYGIDINMAILPNFSPDKETKLSCHRILSENEK